MKKDNALLYTINIITGFASALYTENKLKDILPEPNSSTQKKSFETITLLTSITASILTVSLLQPIIHLTKQLNSSNKNTEEENIGTRNKEISKTQISSTPNQENKYWEKKHLSSIENEKSYTSRTP